MRPFAPAELTHLRTVQGDAMQDTCIVERFVGDLDEYGAPTETYTPGAPIHGGFDPTSRGKREYRRADGTIAVVDAALRLSIADGTALDSRDRIRITHRHGELLAQPLIFGLDGPPERGATGVVLRLVRVE